MHINHLRNLLVTISAFTVIAVMFFAKTENVYSQSVCPSGFDGPITSTFDLCDDGCPVEVVWCCKLNLASPPTIHFVSIKFLGSINACSCVAAQPHHQYDHDIPYLPFDRLMTGLINSGDGCFPGGPPPGITPCAVFPQEPTTTYIEFTSGACYRFNNSFPNMGYYRCETTPENAQCHQSYEICYELVGGDYVIHILPGTPVIPNFQCVGGCHTLCEIMTY